MNKFLTSLKNSAVTFAKDEEGAQVIEYALIIAVVSIALVVALSGLLKGDPFTNFISRVTKCLGTTTCS
jgi:pilus assembly protein Flp/PilA